MFGMNDVPFEESRTRCLSDFVVSLYEDEGYLINVVYTVVNFYLAHDLEDREALKKFCRVKELRVQTFEAVMVRI